MNYEERIKYYLSGTMDEDNEKKLENALLEDDLLLKSFIDNCEKTIESINISEAVMYALTDPPFQTVPLPGRKMRAVICFCGAAAVILCVLLGLDREINDIALSFPEKLEQFYGAVRALYMRT